MGRPRIRTPEMIREYHRLYAAAWRKKHPKRIAAATAKWRKKQDIRINLLSRAKARAKRRGLEFDLTLDDIVWHEKCPVLGTPLDYSTPHGQRTGINGPSLDRWEPAGGYTKKNVVVVSRRANLIKNNGTATELQAVVDYARYGVTDRAHIDFFIECYLQLRDIQLYMHAKFEDVENRLGGIGGQLESMPSRIAKIVSDTLRD